MDKKLIIKLEQIYNSSINKLSNDSAEDVDVPNSPDSEYKTHLLFPAMEDIEEPEIKTKKGKTVLRELPPEDPKDNEIKDIDMYDEDGDEIEDWEDEIEELDHSTMEETVNVLDEQDEDKKSPEEDENGMGEIADANMGEQNPNSGVDPNAQQGMENPDPSQMMGADPSMGNDPSMAGMGMGEEPQKTSEEVGRIFELKKIYSRLLSIESQLSFSSDIILQKLRKFVSDAIELFELLISNVNAYKKEIDEIIIMYYDFLQEIFEILKKYYKNKQHDDKEQIKKNAKSLP